jgi:hypothetical protein
MFKVKTFSPRKKLIHADKINFISENKNTKKSQISGAGDGNRTRDQQLGRL